MNINIYQECQTAAEKLEVLETALGELRRAWDAARSSLDRYAVSDMAGRVGHGGPCRAVGAANARRRRSER